jgi:single-stranded DNA-specific DHH superfamily exonuclease
LHPVLRRVYAGRGIGSDAELDLSLDRLVPVGSLQGVDAAARLLAAHREAGRVLVIGDFDADGATSTALVLRALRALRFAHVDFLVPNRFRFGYGLTPEIVILAAERKPSLIVTVDNGVSSVSGVETARALGIPVLITDHHLPGAELPRAEVIVNPNLAGSRFASTALAGVGVAFYVMVALTRYLAAHGFSRRGPSRSGRRRDGRRCGAAGSQQSGSGGAGAEAHSRRTLRAGYPRAARVRGPQPRAGHCGGFGLCGRAAPQCGRQAHRHVGRDRLPAQR